MAGHLPGERRTPAGPANAEEPASHLYRNEGDGTFVDVTDEAGVGGRGWRRGVAAGDYDNDGHVNLFVTYYGHVVLYHNNGDGTFSDATRAAASRSPAPAGTRERRFSTSTVTAAWTCSSRRTSRTATRSGTRREAGRSASGRGSA